VSIIGQKNPSFLRTHTPKHVKIAFFSPFTPFFRNKKHCLFAERRLKKRQFPSKSTDCRPKKAINSDPGKRFS